MDPSSHVTFRRMYAALHDENPFGPHRLALLTITGTVCMWLPLLLSVNVRSLSTNLEHVYHLVCCEDVHPDHASLDLEHVFQISDVSSL